MNGHGRVTSLDGLRGVAALVVVFNHIFLVAAPGLEPWWMDYTPLHYFFSGRTAVILFFILSGFVLALPYLRGTPPRYRDYVIRRFMRIYVPFAVIVLLSALLYSLCVRPPLMTHLYAWDTPLELPMFLQHLGMVWVEKSSISLNAPMWSLIVEMRISLVFPLLVMFMFRFGTCGAIAGLALGYLACKFTLLFEPFDPYAPHSLIGSLDLTVYYGCFFLFGIWLAQRVEWLQMQIQKIPTWLHAITWLCLLSLPYHWLKTHFTLSDLWYAAIGMYAMVCCLSFPAWQDILSKQLFAWLGKISYSLYLVHTPVLFALLYMLRDTVSPLAFCALALPVVLLAAHIMYRLVERPSMELGRKLTRDRRLA